MISDPFMLESDQETIVKQIADIAKHVQSLEKNIIETTQYDKDALRRLIESECTHQIEDLLRAWKIQKEAIFDTIEFLKQQNALLAKEMNMKIGAIKGVQTKQKQYIDFDSPEAATEFQQFLIEKQQKTQKSDNPSSLS